MLPEPAEMLALTELVESSPVHPLLDVPAVQ